MSALETLEHHEHASHAAEHGNKNAALLVAVLAALLALAEVQAKHAEVKVQENLIAAADAWNQYQAKSIRQAVARDLERLSGTLDMPADPALATQRKALLKTLHGDQEHYESDPKDGKTAIAARAHGFEDAREESLERFHAFDNVVAALELGIVLATASAITQSKMLVRLALGLGLLGVVLAVLGFVAPSVAAF
jgi:hypothetical protein